MCGMTYDTVCMLGLSLSHTHLITTRTAWVSWYQKKHSATHSHEEEEEGFTQTTRSIAWELIPFTVL